MLDLLSSPSNRLKVVPLAGAVTPTCSAWPGSVGLDGELTHDCDRAAGLPSTRLVHFHVPAGSSNSDAPVKWMPRRRWSRPLRRQSCSVKNTRSWPVLAASVSWAYIEPTPSENDECTCMAKR